MTRVIHKVILSSDQQYGKRLPPHQLGLFLAELPKAVRFAISMAMRSRSTQKGQRPGWLNRAADIRLIEVHGDREATLLFEAPRLGEAAGEFYTQKELFWKPPDAHDTGFDLLGDVLSDVEAANADSGRFDRPLLKQLLRFREVLQQGFSDARLESGRDQPGGRVHLTLPILQTAKRLLDETPSPRHVRVVGKLDMVRASNQTFGLKINGTIEVRGVLVEGSIEELAGLLNQDVLTFGQAIFRPSGRLLRMDVDKYRPAAEADRFFAKVPKPIRRAPPKPTALEREKASKGLRAIIGKWPGDETEEQIRQALEELS